MSKEPEVPTMSPEPSDPAATPLAADSAASSKTRRKRGGQVNWSKVKVFQTPEYRTPYKFRMYMAGKRPKVCGEPELWLQVAIESGLVEMGSLEGGGPVGDLLEPLDGHPPARVDGDYLQALVAKGMLDMLLPTPIESKSEPKSNPKSKKDDKP